MQMDKLKIILIILKIITYISSATCQIASSTDEVTIGKQVWMSKNLNVDRFRNGDVICHAKTFEEWNKAGENKEAAWCYHDNNPANGRKYGKLYNWYAVNDPRGLAPAGWHIPSLVEWTTLTDYLGGEAVLAKKLKNTSGWEHNGNGTNESGFSGLPGSYRGPGRFGKVGSWGSWWSSTERNENSAWKRSLNFTNDPVHIDNSMKEVGSSVRCLKD